MISQLSFTMSNPSVSAFRIIKLWTDFLSHNFVNAVENENKTKRPPCMVISISIVKPWQKCVACCGDSVDLICYSSTWLVADCHFMNDLSQITTVLCGCQIYCRFLAWERAVQAIANHYLIDINSARTERKFKTLRK